MGLKLGSSYRNRQSCIVNVEYIALEQRHVLASTLE